MWFIGGGRYRGLVYQRLRFRGRSAWFARRQISLARRGRWCLLLHFLSSAACRNCLDRGIRRLVGRRLGHIAQGLARECRVGKCPNTTVRTKSTLECCSAIAGGAVDGQNIPWACAGAPNPTKATGATTPSQSDRKRNAVPPISPLQPIQPRMVNLQNRSSYSRMATLSFFSVRLIPTVRCYRCVQSP